MRGMIKRMSEKAAEKKPTEPKVIQAEHAAPTTGDTIYSYNHANPHGPFAQGPLPKSLMILGGVMLFGSLYSFFAASTQSSGINSMISVVVGLIDILLVVGLLLRLEAARKAITYLSIAVIVLTALSGFFVYQTFRNLDALGKAANDKIAETRQQPLSAAQEAQLSELETQIIDTDRQVLLLKKRMTNVYIYWGFSIVMHAGIAFYLTRPNIKSQFKKLQ